MKKLWCIIIIVVVLSLTAHSIPAQTQSYYWYSVDLMPTGWEGTDLNDLYFAGGQGWAVGDNGIIINGTALEAYADSKWHKQDSGVSTDLNSVYFLSDSETGWIVGKNGVILHTSNGGVTWEDQQSGTSRHLYDVYFRTELDGFIVGEQGLILYTGNGGLTWMSETVGSRDINAVIIHEDNRGWAVGDGGTILRWNGNDWSAWGSPTVYDLYDVYFVGSTGWAVGQGGIILRYRTPEWVTIRPHGVETGAFFSVDFPISQYGWAVGEKGIILHTSGYGGEYTSWTAQGWSGKDNLNAVYALGPEDAWAVGDKGTIIRSTGQIIYKTEINLISPSGYISDTTPTFEWDSNNRNLSFITYTLFIDNDNTPYDGTSISVGSALSYTLPFSDKLEEGSYSWGVRASDGEESDPMLFVVDLSEPTGLIEINNGDEFTNSLVVTLRLTATDPFPTSGGGSGVKQMKFSGNGSLWSEPEPFATMKSWDMSQYGGNSQDGLKTVYVLYGDALGQWMETPASDSIILDTTPPTGAISIDNGAEVTASIDVVLSLSASDELSGVQPGGVMVLSNNGVDWSEELPYQTSKNWRFTYYKGNEKEGTKTVFVKYRDAAGNWMASPASDDIRLDRTGPVGTVVINNGAESTNSAWVNLTLSASDESGVQSMQFTNGSDKWSQLELYKTERKNWNLTLAEYGGSPVDGKKTVYVRFVDGIGNLSAQAAFDSIELKTGVAASVQIFAPEIQGRIKNNDQVEVSGTSEPGATLLAKDVLDQDNKPLDIDLSGVIFEAATGQITGSFNVGVLTATEIKLKLTMRDALGNLTTVTSINTLTVDNDPPGNISVSINQTSPVKSPSIGLTISATDALEIYVDGDIENQKTWIPYVGTLGVKLTAGDGVKEVRVKFRDDMGNESAEVRNQIILDTTPPTGTIIVDSGAEFTTVFLVALTLSATDGNGVESYQLSNNGTLWNDESQMTDDEMLIPSWDMREYGGNSNQGAKTVYARYKDKAGNWSEPVFDSILFDTTAPSISVQLVPNKQEAMKPVTVTAIIKSDKTIVEADLHYRRKGSIEYVTIPMVSIPGNYYTAEIPGSAVTLDGVEYYISASDGRFTATHPQRDAPIAPNSFTVVDTTRPFIEHEQVTESPVGTSPEIVARVTDALGLKKVSLFYKPPSDKVFTEVAMALDPVLEKYSATIPALNQLGTIMYYIEAIDFSDNVRTEPAKGATQPYAISFVDIIPPVISHTRIANGQEAGTPVVVGATVTDNMAVDRVVLKYRPSNRAESVEVEMTNIGSYYSAEIPGNVVMPGEIIYSITASDGSPKSNDTEVSYSFTVVDTTPPSIKLTFAPSEVEVFNEMSIQAEVTDNVAVAAVELHYKDMDDVTFNTVNMKGVGKKYSATIPGQKQPGLVKFYVYAEDSQGVSSTDPALDPQNSPYVIAVIDIVYPVIQHTPTLGVREAGVPVTITATVTDNVQIDDVSLHYRTAGSEAFKLTPMTQTPGSSLYSGIIPGSAVIPPGVEYYIKAVDSSSNQVTHPAANPDKLPHSFSVEDNVPPEIIYDPAVMATVLITDPIIVTAEVTDLAGIREVRLFYRAADKTSFTSLVCANTEGSKFSAQIPSPLAEGNIYYYIQAEDNSGNISTSPAEDPAAKPHSTYIDDPFPPLPPTRLTASPAPGGRILLTWEPSLSPDVDKYNIYTDNGSGTVDYSRIYDSIPQSALPSDSAAWESPALGEGVYKFVVRAVDKSGNEEENTTVRSAIADATKPEPVTGLAARSQPGGRIRLEWTLSVSKDSAAYNVYWDNAQISIDYSKPLARVSDPGTSWTSDPLRDGIVYRFVVRCQDQAGNEEENTNFRSAQADATPPGKVIGLSSPTHKVNEWSNQPQVTVEWTPAVDSGTGLAGYSLVWDSFAETLPDDIMDIGKETAATETIIGSQYLHIRSVDNAQNWSSEAAHIGPFRIDTELPQAPTNLKASPLPGGRISLSWSASGSTDVIRYNIYGDDGSGRGIDYNTPVGTATGLTWSSPVLKDGTTYQFSVRAEDRAKNEETNTRKVSAVADSQPPSMVHKPIAGVLEQEVADVTIEATVTDASGLDNVRLYYRKRGAADYKETEMAKGANNRYSAEIPASTFSPAGVDYYISASDAAGNVTEQSVMTILVGTVLEIPIDPSSENEILLGDGTNILFPAGAIDTRKDLSITIPKFIPEPQKGLGKHIVTRELGLESSLTKSIRFTMSYSDKKIAGEDESRLAAYLWDGKRWNFLADVDEQDNLATVTTMRLGIFSIIGDYEPPEVSDLQPSGYAEANVVFTATVKDNGSGIAPQDITLLMNGQSLEVPSTALRNEELSLALPGPLKSGEYTLQLTVRDNTGNQTTATTSFQVTGELLLKNVYCYPNPFRPSMGATFAYTLTESVDSVTIRVFGMDGKLARRIEGTPLVGKNLVWWDCKDEAGDPVLSSVYICHIEAEGAEDTVTETIKIAGWE